MTAARGPVRVLVTTFPAHGHFNSVVGVMEELDSRRHDLVLVSLGEDVAPRLARLGIAATCQAVQNDASGSAPNTRGLLGLLRRVRMAMKLSELALLAPVPRQVDRLRSIVREHRPDVVVVNAVAYAAAIAAELEGVPWVAVSPHLIPVAPPSFTDYPAATIWQALAGERQQLFDSFGLGQLRFRVSDVISPWLNTVYATEELISRHDADNDFSWFVGSAAATSTAHGEDEGFPWHRLDAVKGPLIYVAFGSQISPDQPELRRIVTALPPERATFLVSAKDLIEQPELASDLPSNVIAVRYTPQRAVLERADAFVSHGGANSAMECLHAGKPMLVLPYVYDQPVTAHLVARAGAGLSFDPAVVTSRELTDALSQLIAPGSHHAARAQQIADSYRGAGGGKKVVDLIETLARERRPIPAC